MTPERLELITPRSEVKHSTIKGFMDRLDMMMMMIVNEASYIHCCWTDNILLRAILGKFHWGRKTI